MGKILTDAQFAKPRKRYYKTKRETHPDMAMRRCLGHCGKMRWSTYFGDRLCEPCHGRNRGMSSSPLYRILAGAVGAEPHVA